jgi:hypothetical protein
LRRGRRITKVLNPASGRFVKPSGSIGRAVLVTRRICTRFKRGRSRAEIMARYVPLKTARHSIRSRRRRR